jgi:heme-degrading monooxygenase HmoA
MNDTAITRRGCLAWLAAPATAGYALPSGLPTGLPIQLHVDLAVEPDKEEEMLRIFHNSFVPAASRQPGFIDAKMLKLRSALAGSAPPGVNYRFVLIYATEDERQHWIETKVHKETWPLIERTLKTKNYTVLLYDTV